jgi:hypothetical protein
LCEEAPYLVGGQGMQIPITELCFKLGK